MIKPFYPEIFTKGPLFNFDYFFLQKRLKMKSKILDSFSQWVSILDERYFLMFIIYGSVFYFLDNKVDLVQFIILVTLSDQICKQLIKNIFKRSRPCWQVRMDRGNDGKYGIFDEFKGYTKHARSSMCSSHAANFLAQALLINTLTPMVTPVIFPLFVLVGVSRWYVGAHWVSDIVVGWGVGYLAFWLHTVYIYPFLLSFF